MRQYIKPEIYEEIIEIEDIVANSYTEAEEAVEE
jgi:hypothetical protein